jgi:hypothetical protein
MATAYFCCEANPVDANMEACKNCLEGKYWQCLLCTISGYLSLNV